jgi:hypothetical protein
VAQDDKTCEKHQILPDCWPIRSVSEPKLSLTPGYGPITITDPDLVSNFKNEFAELKKYRYDTITIPVWCGFVTGTMPIEYWYCISTVPVQYWYSTGLVSVRY